MTQVTLTPDHPLSGTPVTLIETRHSATPVYMLRLGPCRGPEGQDLTGCVLPVYAGSFEIVEESEDTP